MSQAKIILVAGPTASGKSAFALDLARQYHGAIINADALQIYAGLPILSAQPTATDQAALPHFLYGTLAPTQRSSAGKWVEQAHTAIAAALKMGRMPILVGGTGLYFKALMGGLAEIPPVPDEIRVATAQRYDLWGEEKFRRALSEMDPASAHRLAANDRQRLIRAYEVALHTGHPLSHWHQLSTTSAPYVAETHLIMPERSALYAACDQRFLQMIEKGGVEEMRRFMALSLDDNLPVMKTLGLREFIAHFRNEINLDQAIAKAQQATRNYAKRQMTWFRHQWSF